MVQRYHNPFAAIPIVYPVEQQPDYQMYAQAGRSPNVDRSPFPRMVDLWWAGLSLAVRKDLPLVDLRGSQTAHMENGQILDRDSWRVQVVMLIALHVTNEVEVVTDPARMMAIANGLAAAGVPHIVEMLTDGDESHIWNISKALENLVSD